jgi:hypothetical protein
VAARIDVNDMIDRIDVNDMIDRIDVNAVLDQVDIGRLLARIDILKLEDRAELGETLSEHTSRMAQWNVDLVERQASRLGTAVERVRQPYQDGIPAGSHSSEEGDGPESK